MNQDIEMLSHDPRELIWAVFKNPAVLLVSDSDSSCLHSSSHLQILTGLYGPGLRAPQHFSQIRAGTGADNGHGNSPNKL